MVFCDGTLMLLTFDCHCEVPSPKSLGAYSRDATGLDRKFRSKAMSRSSIRIPYAVSAAGLPAMLALLLIGSPARAGTVPLYCPSLDATQAATASTIAKGGGASEMLSSNETSRYLAIINSEPPQTHLAAARVLFLARPDGRVVLGLVFGTNVCVVGSIGKDLHERALAAAREHGA
jgi:hypothetical protein